MNFIPVDGPKNPSTGNYIFMNTPRIYYSEISSGIHWIVIKNGKTIAEGVNSTMEKARILAENVEQYFREKEHE